MPACVIWKHSVCLWNESQISWGLLVVRCLRTLLPIQETQVWARVWDEPTGRGAAKPVCHSYWSPHAPQPVLHNKRQRHNEQPPLPPEKAEKPEKAHTQQQKPSAAKRWIIFFSKVRDLEIWLGTTLVRGKWYLWTRLLLSPNNS